jgi:tetratricopeptide (TPR) repeat protein
MTSLRPSPRLLGLSVLAALSLGACNQPSDLALDHIRRGDAAIAAGRYTQALIAFNHARDLMPSDPNVQRALMRGRAFLLADQPARLGADAVEEERYEVQVLLDTDPPRQAAYLTAMGNILGHGGDLEGARAKYAEALKADPGSPLAHTALGLTLLSRKETLEQAKAEFDAALKTSPEHVAALVGLAQVKAAEGDPGGAAEKLEAALKLVDDFGSRMLLGQIRTQQGKAQEAMEQFQRAAQLEPKNGDALLSLGQALLGAGKPEEAERPLRSAYQIRNDEASSMALGYALMRQHKAEPALGLFTQILGQNATSVPALFGAASTSEDLGKKTEAMDYFRRTVAQGAEQKGAPPELKQEAQKHLDALVAAAAAASAAAMPDGGAPKTPPPDAGAGRPPGGGAPAPLR